MAFSDGELVAFVVNPGFLKYCPLTKNSPSVLETLLSWKTNRTHSNKNTKNKKAAAKSGCIQISLLGCFQTAHSC